MLNASVTSRGVLQLAFVLWRLKDGLGATCQRAKTLCLLWQKHVTLQVFATNQRFDEENAALVIPK